MCFLMFQMILLVNTTDTYHKTIKIKPMDVRNDSFAEYNDESNEKDPKFKVADHNWIS